MLISNNTAATMVATLIVGVVKSLIERVKEMPKENGKDKSAEMEKWVLSLLSVLKSGRKDLRQIERMRARRGK